MSTANVDVLFDAANSNLRGPARRYADYADVILADNAGSPTGGSRRRVPPIRRPIPPATAWTQRTSERRRSVHKEWSGIASRSTPVEGTSHSRAPGEERVRPPCRLRRGSGRRRRKRSNSSWESGVLTIRTHATCVFIEYRWRQHLGMTFTSFNQDGGSGYAQVYQPEIAPINEWHHMVYTIDEIGRCLFLSSTANYSITFGFATPYQYLSEDALYIGQSNLASIPYQFEGEIDEVAIYDTALSSAQVWNHYSQLAEPPVPGVGELLLSEQINLEPFGAADYNHYGVNLFYSDDQYSNFPTGDATFRGVEITDFDLADPVGRAGPITVGDLEMTSNITVNADDDGRRQYASLYGEDAYALAQMASGFFYVNGDHPLLEMTFSGPGAE